MDLYKAREDTEVKLRRMEVGLNSRIMDRTGLLANDRNIISPIPAMPESELDFDTVTDNRAKEILALGSPIRVMYSGGIDSTLALTALLKHKADYQDVEITVVLSDESIKENPYFYENFIDGHLAVMKYVPPAQKVDVENSTGFSEFVMSNDDGFVLVTGEVGDQLFGSSITLRNPELAGLPFATTMNKQFLEDIDPILADAPYELVTCADLLWWINFTLKYQWVQLRTFGGIDIAYDRLYHFFDTVEYQQWAMTTTMDVKWPDFDLNTYKLPAKQYIFEFDSNQDYLDNKLKVGSLQFLHVKQVINGYPHVLIRIDENFNKEHIPAWDGETVENADGTIEHTLKLETRM